MLTHFEMGKEISIRASLFRQPRQCWICTITEPRLRWNNAHCHTWIKNTPLSVLTVQEHYTMSAFNIIMGMFSKVLDLLATYLLHRIIRFMNHLTICNTLILDWNSLFPEVYNCYNKSRQKTFCKDSHLA